MQTHKSNKITDSGESLTYLASSFEQVFHRIIHDFLPRYQLSR